MKAWIGSVRTMSKSDVVDAGEQVECVCVCVCVRVRLSQSGMCAATEPFVRARAVEPVGTYEGNKNICPYSV